jgi:ribosomal protein S18 acetylase RimI-like enzyme
MPSQPFVRAIEECALNAWPGLRQRELDGWLLRFADGFTRRANSVNPLHPGRLDVAEKLARCEAAYRAQGLPVVFRITPLADPPGLDALLAARGYGREGETRVQLLDPLRGAASDPACTLADVLDERWLEPFAELDEAPLSQRAARRAILAAIALPHTGAVIQHGDRAACGGRAVLEDEHVGLFGIATDPAQRRRGHARRLARHLLAWGQALGARRAYLQVEADNAPALRLYESLGFREVYRYWYRVK